MVILPLSNLRTPTANDEILFVDFPPSRGGARQRKGRPTPTTNDAKRMRVYLFILLSRARKKKHSTWKLIDYYTCAGSCCTTTTTTRSCYVSLKLELELQM
jgi:hypothetical protein